jgi:hypothetical protein
MLSEFVIVKLAMPVPVKANPTRFHRFFSGCHDAPKSKEHKVLESRNRTSIQKMAGQAPGRPRATDTAIMEKTKDKSPELLYCAGCSLHYGYGSDGVIEERVLYKVEAS